MSELENWRAVVGYEGLYEVSDLGHVRSLNYNHTGKVKVLSPFINNDGYLRVKLCKNKKRKMLFVHRLVYQSFVGDIPEGLQVNHINEDKKDNRLINLNLMTSKENNNWGTRNLRISKPILQFTKEGEFVREWCSMMEIERQLKIANTHICECCQGKYKSAGGYIWRYKEEREVV